MSTLLSEISELFALAEEKIKLIQNLIGELAFPAVNQLRYVAFHLLRAEKEPNTDTKKEEYRKAKNHCERAIYDAVEAGIVYCLYTIRIFQEDYRTVIVPNILPDYIDICKKATEANHFISTMTKDSIGDHCSNRGDQYRESTNIFNELHDAIKLLTSARPELNKKIKKQRIAFLVTMISIIIAIIGLIIGLVSLPPASPQPSQPIPTLPLTSR